MNAADTSNQVALQKVGTQQEPVVVEGWWCLLQLFGAPQGHIGEHDRRYKREGGAEACVEPAFIPVVQMAAHAQA